jgi:hypothetical protein
MDPESPAPPQARRPTLVAVLVGLVLTAVLIALLLPMLSIDHPVARNAKAKQDVLNIVHGVEAYYTEYGLYPVLDPSAARRGGKAVDEAAGDPAAGMRLDNARLFNTLLAIDRAPNAQHTQNPKKQVFFMANAVANPKSPSLGFQETAGASGVQGAFYDPWGSQYNVVIDSNEDNKLDLGAFYSDFAGDAAPRAGFGAFSLGKDKKLGKGGDRKYQSGDERSDDQVSWPDEKASAR